MINIDNKQHTSQVPKLLILSYADKCYYKFVIPFIVFARHYNPGCKIEIVVDSVENFSAEYANQLGILYQESNDFVISQSTFNSSRLVANNIRFFHNPEIYAQYVYICDIDILIMDDILKLHLPHLAKYNTFYSNIVRKGSNPPRMTGLHFIKFDCYYPVSNEEFDLSENDEVNLYKLMKLKHPNEIVDNINYRPVPGIHISLNRNPFGHAIGNKRIGWEYQRYASEFMKFSRGTYYHNHIDLFDLSIKHILIIVEYAITGTKAEMSIISLLYGIDPKFFLPDCGEAQYISTNHHLTSNFILSLGKFISNIYNSNHVSNYLITLLKCGCVPKAIELGNAYIKWHYNRFKNLQFVHQINKNTNEDKPDVVDVAAKFIEIYEHNGWNNKETKSGSGSTLQATKSILFQLPQLFTKYKIKFIIDAGCGDMNWMSHLLKTYPLYYLGIDIVPALISENDKQYGSPNIIFMHGDIRKISFPTADAMLCRDCLFHFSYTDINIFLHNFMASTIEYIIITSHINNGFLNSDIKTGQWRMIDLMLPPFSFPYPLESIQDGDKKQLCLWSKSQIANMAFLSSK